VHHVGILYGQFMMHGQRNIKSQLLCFVIRCDRLFPFRVRIALNVCKFTYIIKTVSLPNQFRRYLREINSAIPKTEAACPSETSELTYENIRCRMMTKNVVFLH